MITYSNGQNFTVSVNPIITFKHWFGESCSPDASFDFSNVPKELHYAYFIRLMNCYNKNQKPVLCTHHDTSILGRFFKGIKKWLI